MIRIEFYGDAIWRALESASGSMDDQTHLMTDIAEYMVASTKRRFIEGESPDGISWAPKSETTMEAYRRWGDNPDPRPLFGPSLTLSRAIFGQSGPDYAEFGTNVIQAAVLHFGSDRGALGQAANGSPIPWGAIPARPFLGVSDFDEDEISELVREWVLRAWDAD